MYIYQILQYFRLVLVTVFLLKYTSKLYSFRLFNTLVLNFFLTFENPTVSILVQTTSSFQCCRKKSCSVLRHPIIIPLQANIHCYPNQFLCSVLISSTSVFKIKRILTVLMFSSHSFPCRLGSVCVPISSTRPLLFLSEPLQYSIYFIRCVQVVFLVFSQSILFQHLFFSLSLQCISF